MKKTFRFLLSVIIVLLVLFMTCSAALADIIVIPEEKFYDEHREACEYVDRYYIANGEKGYVKVYSEPGKNALAYILNGEKLYVSFTFEHSSGAMANIAYYTDESGSLGEHIKEGETFWVYTSELVPCYDNAEFMNEHAAEITELNPPVTLPANTEICVYEYPCSENRGEVWTIWEEAVFDTGYTDEEGRLWGYISYYYGSRDMWVCLDDPANADIPCNEKTLDLIPAAEPTDASEFGAQGLSTIAVAAIAVGALAVITLIVILIVFGKKKKNVNSAAETDKKE